MNRAIVLTSGGMDSLVTTAIAFRDNEQVYLMHVNYGQRTEAKELDCFYQVVRHYHPFQSRIFDMSWLGKIGGSALTDSKIIVPEYTGDGKVPVTYVPFRNANLIAAAVSWAEVIEANRIYIGVVEEDSSGYPDCRQVFLNAMQRVIESGIKALHKIELVAPVIGMKKSEIVQLGISLRTPFEYSWSCYSDNDLACGVCDSCQLRLKAFAQAGLADPIPYRNNTD